MWFRFGSYRLGRSVDREDPLVIAGRRLARGEITPDEYERIKITLEKK